MLPMLLPSHHLIFFFIYFRSLWMLRPPVRFRILDMGLESRIHFIFFLFFRLTLYDARRAQPGIRKAEECLAVATCTSARVHSTPITIFPIFLHTFLLGFFLRFSLSLSFSFHPCVALCAIFSNLLRSLPSSSSSPFLWYNFTMAFQLMYL